MGVIAHQLGHSDIRMTEKHYAHLSPDYVAAQGVSYDLVLADSSSGSFDSVILPELGGELSFSFVETPEGVRLIVEQVSQPPPPVQQVTD